MGNSRRQRSTSATRRRAERRRQSSSADGIDEETTTTTFHGLSSILIWILATSSLVVVITPQTTSHQIRSTSHDPVSSIEKFIRESVSSSFKMNAPYNNQMEEGNDEQSNKAMFMPFRRQQGLRWRDDDRMMAYFNNQNYDYPIRPILTEQQQYPFSMGASTSNHHASTSDFNEIGLMDLDLIDILWRSDIAVEKGTQQVEPSDQYESDLQTLTEKSTVQVLTSEEQARYEGYSRNYYQGFFVNNNQFYQKPNQHQIKICTPEQQTPPNESDGDLPTDDDLEDLLKDVSSEESELNKVFGNNSPVDNDVSLTDALVYTSSNMTELQDMQNSCNQVNITASAVVSSSQSETLFNDTDVHTHEQWQSAEVTPSEVFPQSNYVYIPMQNDSAQQVISNGQISYDHSYSGSAQAPMSPLSIGTSNNGRQQQTQTSPSSVTVTATPTERYNPYAMRHSFSDSNTDSSSQCSRLSSESPRYNSESSSSVHETRFYGKLVPSRESRFERSRSPHSSIKIGRVVSLNGQRKRGRQSKDEQLATESGLPVSAHQISEMSLSDLQQVLKDDSLSEFQKQLIRKIRRRGKNKVAARTCRQRRTDRHDKVLSLYN